MISSIFPDGASPTPYILPSRLNWTPDSLQPDGPRYLAVVERIAQDVSTGALPGGTQLPPQRELATQLGVDVSTISRAYSEAKKRGLVAAHVGRGTFVRARAEASVDNPMRMGELSLVDLSRNFPASSVITAAEQELSATLQSFSTRGSFAGLLDYQPHAGRLDHREAGAGWIERRALHRPASQVVVTCGAQHALTAILLAYAPPGSTVMAEALTYPAFNMLADRFRLNVVPLAMDSEGIIPDSLREACEDGGRVLYCTPTLQNPTAGLMSMKRREDIAEIALAYDVLVIEDDVHGALPRHAPPALSSLLPEKSFYVASLSKSVAPGLRIAYVAAPDERATAQLAASMSATTWMAVPLTAEVAAQWIRSGVAERLVAANQQEANRRQRSAERLLMGCDWRSHPESYHGWLTLSHGWSTAEFVMQARRHNILVTPSDAFAVTRIATPAAVRLSLCAASSVAAMEHALERIRDLIHAGPNSAASLL